MIRKFLKMIIGTVYVLTFFLISYLVDISLKDKKKKLCYHLGISSFYAKLCLKLLGVTVRCIRPNVLNSRSPNYLTVSNHLSYIDIFVILSLKSSVFLANAELIDEFLLGRIIKSSGALFVERRNRALLLSDLQRISERLIQGFNVVLFPEGTTSDGGGVLPFKSSFFDTAIKSGVDVIPICIKYINIDGNQIDSKNRELVVYHGPLGFFQHLERLLSLRSIEVEITELEKVRLSSNKSRKELAGLSYDGIRKAYESSI